jgi:hypothetical protein
MSISTPFEPETPSSATIVGSRNGFVAAIQGRSFNMLGTSKTPDMLGNTTGPGSDVAA